MAQNNLNHFSDLSKYKIFDPTNTQWPTTVKDVQTALALIGSWARTDKGLPLATESVAGIGKVATQAQITAGTDDTTFVTPKKLAVRLTQPAATTTVLGLTYYATNAEAAALTLTSKAIVPSSLGYVFNNVTATNSRFGTIKTASNAVALAGTDNTTATTPAGVVAMIAKFAPVAPSYAQGSETASGLIQLATQGQTAQGTLRTGFAVSPYGFVNTRATATQVGTIRLSTAAEGKGLSDNTTAITPSILNQIKGTYTTYGIVRLAGGYDSDPTAALASTAPVVFTDRTINGKALTSNIVITTDDLGTYNRAQLDARYLQIGQGGNWSRCYAAVTSVANSTLTMNTDLPVNGGATMALTVKFDRNGDGTNNRVYYFDILVNGVKQLSDSINIYNTRGGSKGHSWLFEGYGTRYYQFSVPAGATVQIVPTNTYLVTIVNCMMTVNN